MTEPNPQRRRRRRSSGAGADAAPVPGPGAAPGAPPPPDPPRAERRPAPRDQGERRSAPRDQGERGLRDLVGAGRSQLGVSGALRGRDVDRPTDEDLAEAEQTVVIVRRHWTPPA